LLTENARVVAVEEGSIWVETVRQSVCGSCSAARGCGHGLLNRLGDGRRSYLRLSSEAFADDRFEVGDEVAIGISESLMVTGSFVVYLAPLICMLAAALVAPRIFPAGADVAAIVGAGLGLLLGMGLVRLHAWLHRGDSALQPVLLGPAGTR